MKDTVQNSPATTPRVSARTRTSSRQQADYVPATEVRALLANSLAARQQRLGAADMISTDEAAQLVQTTRVTINAWIAKGRAIGLTQTKRGFRMPRWQFEPSMWDSLPRLSAALGTAEDGLPRSTHQGTSRSGVNWSIEDGTGRRHVCAFRARLDRDMLFRREPGDGRVRVLGPARSGFAVDQRGG